MKTKLYRWQEECLKKWFANNGRGMVQAVTGSGKTRLALAAAAALDKGSEPLRVKIVVPTAALMRQWSRALQEFQREMTDVLSEMPEIGLRGGGRKDAPDRKYMIYVINSARYELARQILSDLEAGRKVFLIADECHHYTSGENQLIFEFLPHIKENAENFFSMGLSATLPSGEAKQYLNKVLGKCIYRYGIREALSAQTVCGYDVFHIELCFQKEERAEYEELTERIQFTYNSLLKKCPELRNTGRKELYDRLRMLAGNRKSAAAKEAALYLNLVLKRKKIVCLAKDRTECALKLLSLLDAGQKTIVFGERISQTDELFQMLQKRFPGKVGRYHSKMGNTANRNVLERFRNGEIRILLACKSMDEGVDVPDAAVGIILSGTSMQRQRIQRLGRIIRRSESKDRASVYYLHIAETSEDQYFLPEEDDTRVFELEYADGRFRQHIYDQAAEQMLSEAQMRGSSQAALAEIRRCMNRGSVRADWQMDGGAIERKIKEAKTVKEKNYWICMKKIKEVFKFSFTKEPVCDRMRDSG